MKRFIAAIEYDGSNYRGWQRQPFLMNDGLPVPTVQASLESALSKFCNHEIEVFCAGRTDAGVNAVQQIIHFDSQAERKSWLHGVNRYLPDDIRMTWISETSPDFHARYSASARHYRYLFKDDGIKSALWQKKIYVNRRKLNIEKIIEASEILIGEHDFSSFRSSECQAKSPMREIKSIKIIKLANYYALDICGNAFLHHMVRNITGSLFLIGEGKRDKNWLAEVLAAKNRTSAGATAPAEALYLLKVYYPKRFIVPPSPTFFGNYDYEI